MAHGALTGLRSAIEDGRGDDMVSQMVDFYASKLKP
jgi:2-hydroxy-3-oxopropionate reductase